MASELELLLQAYGGQGEYDSSGSFTVDPDKLREKLSRFLLPEPHAYILKLVQWAVALERTQFLKLWSERVQAILKRRRS